MRIGSASLVFLLLASLLPAQTDTAPLKKQAQRLVLAEQPAAALEILARAREQTPRDPEVPIWTAEAYFQLENYEKAVTAFREAIALDPSAAPFLQNLGHALLKLQRLAEAREQFQLIADRAKSPAAKARGLVGVGLTLAEEGNEKQARVRFEDALKLDPTLLRARYRLALVQTKSEENSAAIENLRAVVQKDPLFEGAAYNLALAYRAARNEAGAKEWEERFKQVRKDKRELEDLKGTLRKTPGNADLVLAIARVYARAGSHADAIDWYKRVVDARPEDAAARAELEAVRKAAGKQLAN